MRVFVLHRDNDPSGVSGVGVVAEGVEFGDGRCVMRWLTGRSSIAIYRCLEDIESIHGHNGATRIVFIHEDGS